MPKQAKCFLTEDYQLLLDVAVDYIESGGHAVVARASNLRDALEQVTQLKELGVTVAVLDGNLSVGDSSGNDGRRIAEAIRALGLGIRIICLSIKEYNWADCCINKSDLSTEFSKGRNILAEAIDGL